MASYRWQLINSDHLQCSSRPTGRKEQHLSIVEVTKKHGHIPSQQVPILHWLQDNIHTYNVAKDGFLSETTSVQRTEALTLCFKPTQRHWLFDLRCSWHSCIINFNSDEADVKTTLSEVSPSRSEAEPVWCADLMHSSRCHIWMQITSGWRKLVEYQFQVVWKQVWSSTILQGKTQQKHHHHRCSSWVSDKPTSRWDVLMRYSQDPNIYHWQQYSLGHIYSNSL